MKGDMMSKRVYHLTIEYDADTEEIEYVDKETLKEILQNYEVGEA